jgi:anti-sigma factor RsiW
MNNELREELQWRIQAYLDNELDPREAQKAAQEISSSAEAQALFAELSATRKMLRHAGEESRTVPASREFYWSAIQRGIEAAERSEQAKPALRPWWLRLLVPMAGAVALFAILASFLPQGSQSLSRGIPLGPELPPTFRDEVESTNPEVSAFTFRSESEGVTVVWVSAK